jgi:hypothetical protein
MARLFVKHLDAHLAVAFVEEVYQAADLDVVVSGTSSSWFRGTYCLPHRTRPPRSTARFPQGHRGRLSTDEKFGERVQELLLAERVVFDEDDELEVLFAGQSFSSGGGERATRPPLQLP